MGRTWGLELGLCHWNNSGTIGSSLVSSKEPWSGVPGPLESGSQPIAVGPEVDPEIWWVVPEDNPFSIGPLQVGQGMVGGRGFGQDLAPCPLVTSEAEVWRVRSHMGELRLADQRG